MSEADRREARRLSDEQRAAFVEAQGALERARLTGDLTELNDMFMEGAEVLARESADRIKRIPRIDDNGGN